MHGVEQSEAVTKTAQALSSALANQRGLALIIARASVDEKAQYVARAQDASNRVVGARAAYKVAYKAYTNPFGVEKTFS